MKMITIRELHTRTGHFVREASDEPIVVTERGRKMALLIPFSNQAASGVSFPGRRLRDLVPLAQGAKDSADLISEDRDRA